MKSYALSAQDALPHSPYLTTGVELLNNVARFQPFSGTEGNPVMTWHFPLEGSVLMCFLVLHAIIVEHVRGTHGALKLMLEFEYTIFVLRENWFPVRGFCQVPGMILGEVSRGKYHACWFLLQCTQWDVTGNTLPWSVHAVSESPNIRRSLAKK